MPQSATEHRAGAALQRMITDERLTVAEAVQWCAGAISHREAGRLRQLTEQAKCPRIAAPPSRASDDAAPGCCSAHDQQRGRAARASTSWSLSFPLRQGRDARPWACRGRAAPTPAKILGFPGLPATACRSHARLGGLGPNFRNNPSKRRTGRNIIAATTSASNRERTTCLISDRFRPTPQVKESGIRSRARVFRQVVSDVDRLSHSLRVLVFH